MSNKILALFQSIGNYGVHLFYGGLDLCIDSLVLPIFIVGILLGLVIYCELLMSYVLILLCRFNLTAIPFFCCELLVCGTISFSTLEFVYGLFEMFCVTDARELFLYFSSCLESATVEPKPLHLLEFKIDGVDEGVIDITGKDALKREVQGYTTFYTFAMSIVILGSMVLCVNLCA